MNIFPTNAASDATSVQAAATAEARTNSAMGKEEFLRLLVTQLGNQDPMNPMDGQQFAAQLAQFTSVEQLININETMAGQGEMNGLLAQSINSGVAAGLIGKTVEASGNGISWGGEGTAELGFSLPKAAADVKVTVRDHLGNVVTTLDIGGRAPGKHTATWDGTNEHGTAMPEGQYTFEVAGEANGSPVHGQTFTTGRVDRISFGASGILLWLGGTSIPMNAVNTVRE